MNTTHTKGPWKLEAGRNIVTPSGTFFLSYGKDKHGNPYFKDFVELDNNAALIAEAGTVAHETGKTPRQLAEENRELLESLREIATLLRQLPDFERGNSKVHCCAQAAMTAIAKAEGRD